MGCEGGNHLWTARFYRSGLLAFWFCSRCGDTDREVVALKEPLENTSGFPDDFPFVTVEGESPVVDSRRWRLSDGSILEQLEPGSAEFRGLPLPGIPDSYRYMLTISGSGEQREYSPKQERSSTREDCFILTRYRVEGDRLIKYRVHCCEYIDESGSTVDEPSGNSILTGLEPV